MTSATTAISVSLHVAVLLWVVDQDRREDAKVSHALRADEKLAPPRIEVATGPGSPALEVELYIEPAVDAPARDEPAIEEPAARPPRRSPSGSRIATKVAPPNTPEVGRSPAPPASPEPTAPPAAPPDRMTLAMRPPGSGVPSEHGRGSASLDLRLDEGARSPPAPGATALTAIAALDQPPEGAAGPEGAELIRQRDGTHRADEDAFTAKVDRDGKVTFDDRSPVQPSAGPGPAPPGLDPSLQRGNPDLAAGGVGVRMDATDWMMRRRGIDPLADKKRAFLDRTRAQRVELGRAHRRHQLSRSAVLMQENIDRLWAETTDVNERKATLFELWDECAESGSAELVAGGIQARAVVIRIIRTRLRGAEAYTADELAALNARRRSQATFAPYR